MIANEYKDKFMIRSTKIDNLLEIQRSLGDKCGLGLEEGESSKSRSIQVNPRFGKKKNNKTTTRQRNDQRTSGKCFIYNKFCHKSMHYINMIN